MPRTLIRQTHNSHATFIIKPDDYDLMEGDTAKPYSPKDYLIFETEYKKMDNKNQVILDRYTLLRLVPAWVLPFSFAWSNNYVLATEHDRGYSSYTTFSFEIIDPKTFVPQCIWNDVIQTGVGSCYRFSGTIDGGKITWSNYDQDDKIWFDTFELPNYTPRHLVEDVWSMSDRIKRYWLSEWKRKQSGEYDRGLCYREEVLKKYSKEERIVHSKNIHLPIR